MIREGHRLPKTGTPVGDTSFFKEAPPEPHFVKGEAMRRLTALIRLTVVMLLFAAVFQVQVRAAQASVCTEGQFKNVVTGPICSCGGTSTPKDRYQCIGGVWEYQYSFCAGPFCQEGGGEDWSCQAQPFSCPYVYVPSRFCPAECSCCY